MAYAGLRPGEALALRWADVANGSLLVDKAVALGEEKPTKTRKTRTVPLLTPLAADLRSWRMASGRPSPSSLLFPAPDGGHWDDGRYTRWRGKAFSSACDEAGLENVTPYTLRHTYVSLLLAEGVPVLEVARRAGHAPSVAWDTYGHVVEIGGMSAEEAIAQARREIIGELSPGSPFASTAGR